MILEGRAEECLFCFIFSRLFVGGLIGEMIVIRVSVFVFWLFLLDDCWCFLAFEFILYNCGWFISVVVLIGLFLIFWIGSGWLFVNL